jgi:hypothetical protein
LFTVALPPPSPCSLVCDYSALGVRHHYSQVPGGGICLLFFYVVAVTALSETSAPQKRSLRSAIRMSIKSQATFSTELLLGSVAEAPFAASFGLV